MELADFAADGYKAVFGFGEVGQGFFFDLAKLEYLLGNGLIFIHKKKALNCHCNHRSLMLIVNDRKGQCLSRIR